MKRKRNNNHKTGLLLLAAFFAGSINLFAQDSVKKDLNVTVSYYMTDNKMVYLLVNTTVKVERKFEPVKDIAVNLYLGSAEPSNLIAKLKTDETGKAKAFLPPALQAAWETSETQTFTAVTEANKEYDETEGEATITKTKISVDTASDEGARSITVSLTAKKGEEWVPAADVEMKVGIWRLGGILSAGEEPSYTTDSSGTVTVAYNKDSLPGDEKGNFILAVKVDNNDEYGNLLYKETVPWGVSVKPDNHFFDQRTLWSTRNHTPVWLLFMAYSIAFGVWGTIIYLIFQVVKIKKLSRDITSG